MGENKMTPKAMANFALSRLTDFYVWSYNKYHINVSKMDREHFACLYKLFEIKNHIPIKGGD